MQPPAAMNRRWGQKYLLIFLNLLDYSGLRRLSSAPPFRGKEHTLPLQSQQAARRMRRAACQPVEKVFSTG